MIRVLSFLAAIAALAALLIFVADRPGEVAIALEHWHIQTSLAVALAALMTLAAMAVGIWIVLRKVWLAPVRAAAEAREHRKAQGLKALSHGLLAVGAGDLRTARKNANAAQKLVPGEPLALLLAAQTAQLAGDTASAEDNFRKMAAREETKLLGLRGLFIEARRRDDPQAARVFAEEAARAAPALEWAGQAVLQLRCAAGDWEGALQAIDQARKAGTLDKATYRRHRAVLLTAQALALETRERDRARALVLEAVKLAPDLVPAAGLAGRFHAEAGELRKAQAIVEKAWQAEPHPDLAAVYANLRFGDSARERLTRARTLAAKRPGHPESALALARAAIDAREFALAREALAAASANPTRRAALLMAEIEEREHGDQGRAREWMRRALRAARDPAWIADGVVFEQWLPISPVSGRLDAFAWTTLPTALPPAEDRPEKPDETAIDLEALAPEKPAAPAAAPVAPASSPPPAAAARAAPPPQPPIPDIVASVQAPDDPGPEPDPYLEENPPPRRWRLFG